CEPTSRADPIASRPRHGPRESRGAWVAPAGGQRSLVPGRSRDWDNVGVNTQPEDEQAPKPDVEPDIQEATVRRAPKWGAFIVYGMLVGLIVTIAVTTAFPADPNSGMTMTVLIVGIFGVSGGAALGGIAAIIADRVSRGRVREITVERGEV